MAEDYSRFALGDAHLTRLCKQLRHDLVEAVDVLTQEQRAAARDTQADVGTTVSTATEGSRQSLAHIVAAAWPRIHQALRVIEECLKLFAPEAAGRVEALRYRSYTLAKACTLTADSQHSLAGARLYVLLDGGPSECAFVERVQALVEAGVHVLQLRDKRLADRELLARARLLRRVIDAPFQVPSSKFQDESFQVPSSRFPVRDAEAVEPGTLNLEPETSATLRPLFILNDRPDLAVLARADGVHVGQEELTVHDARQIVGAHLLVGVSTHSIEQARQAVLDGANYIGCGPTFRSATKQFEQFAGLDFLRQVAAEISLPAFAIGGITLENVEQVKLAGFTRIAVSGAIAAATDVKSAAGALAAALRP